MNARARGGVAWLLGLALLGFFVTAPARADSTEWRANRGTGDLGLIIERTKGRILIIETTRRTVLKRLGGLGDLSHASAVFSRDQRYAFIFGRDGGLTKVDLVAGRIVKRVIQAGNSIGGAISQDGKLVAVSNYKPGGVRVFDAETLALVADIPATGADGKRSKVIGLVDAPGQRFVFGLYDAGEIWMADFSASTKPGAKPKITRYTNIGTLPYDGLITPDGRAYVAGLFGEDGLAKLDLWHPEKGVTRILAGYGRGEKKLPVYKMPHLEGWAAADGKLFLPAIGRHELLVVDDRTWKEVGRIKVHGQPVFAVARPDGRQIWVNFAHPRNDTLQVIDVATMKIVKAFKPGKAILHMEFTPRGEQVWVSVRDADRVDVYDTRTFKRLTAITAEKPSGIFLSARAHKTGL
jgi:protein NirF